MDLNIELAELHEAVRVPEIQRRKAAGAQFWDVVAPLIAGAPHLEETEIGRSAQGRPLRMVRFGAGETKVLIWSQMHGDEPTGTMALADVLRLLAERADDPRIRRWSESLTILIVPVLNPDGAARYQRRNAQGVDMNRDGRTRISPEVRALLALREEHRPEYALELHNEDSKTRVGESDLMTGASLIAPTFDRAMGDSEARLAAKRLCVVIKKAIEPLLGEHIARFEEDYLADGLDTATQAAGTATVLFETGWWPMDPEMQFLRKVNFVGICAMLDALVGRAHEHMDLAEYEAIRRNDRRVFDVLLRGGAVVLPGAAPFKAELGLNFEDPLDVCGGHIADVGDLTEYSARDILIAEGMFVHPEEEALVTGEDGKAWLEVGRPASFTIRRGEDPGSEAIWTVRRGVVSRVAAPDAG